MIDVQCAGAVVAVTIYDVVQDGVENLAMNTKPIRSLSGQRIHREDLTH